MEPMSLEHSACNFDISFIKVGAHSKRTAGSALADATMTNSGDLGLPSDSIADCSTKTSTFSYFSDVRRALMMSEVISKRPIVTAQCKVV